MPANEHDSAPSGQALPAGTRLEEFVIERVLGSGGFGITYLARDARLNRQVVIKENLPAQFCYRDTHSLTVAPRHTSAEDAENFRWSLENFSKESAMLASLDHPGIVKVLRSFEAFGTAYFVMPFVNGETFDKLIESHKAKSLSFDEDGLRGLLEHTLAALNHLHDRGIYHRDIKPGNILVTQEGIPVLIDFGSARQRLSERSMTVVESPGYTPFEQLQSRGNVGPWSDLYALGGTLCKALTGEAPPKANDRIRKDPHVPLANRPELARTYSAAFLGSIDKALAVDEEERWQNAGEWLAALQGKNTVKQPSSMADRSARTPLASNKNIKPMHWVLAGCVILGLCAWAMISSNNKHMIKPVVAVADDAADLPGFALIPGGEFIMGDTLDGDKDAPQHKVNVSAFYMQKKEVSKAEWDEVRAWGLENGYTDLPEGKGKAANHPVQTVSWYDVVKWCNARSQKEGLTSCYYTDVAHTGLYKTGKMDLANTMVKWGAKGYRLPTEAEWEKAARGGLSGKRFPWGDVISHEQANFSNSGKESYQKGSTGFHPTYKTGGIPYTSPVGGFVAYGYGLYNMTGNVREWCWDWYGTYHTDLETDPAGPSGSDRVIRGGDWCYSDGCRVAYRNGNSPGSSYDGIGFRTVRR